MQPDHRSLLAGLDQPAVHIELLDPVALLAKVVLDYRPCLDELVVNDGDAIEIHLLHINRTGDAHAINLSKDALLVDVALDLMGLQPTVHEGSKLRCNQIGSINHDLIFVTFAQPFDLWRSHKLSHAILACPLAIVVAGHHCHERRW